MRLFSLPDQMGEKGEEEKGEDEKRKR